MCAKTQKYLRQEWPEAIDLAPYGIVTLGKSSDITDHIKVTKTRKT